MTWYQEWFGEEYLEIYAHRDDDEARRQVEFLRRMVGRIDGRVLDLACGSGRHLSELRSRGYDAVGLDLSLVLLTAARRRDPSLPLVRGDMRRLPFCDRTFSGLVNFFTSFGYFESEEDNTDVVSEMSRVLEPRAPFLFDYMNVPRELKNLVPHESRTVDGSRVQIERWFDEPSRTFNKRMTIDGRTFIERVRAYELDEVAVLFTANGMAIEGVYGDFEGNALTPDSPRLIVVGERR